MKNIILNVSSTMLVKHPFYEVLIGGKRHENK